MKRLIPIVAFFAMSVPLWALAQKTLVLVDGTRMEVQSYEVQDNVVRLTTLEGKLRSVPRSYVNVVATERLNGGGEAETPPPARAPRAPAPPPARAPVPVSPPPALAPPPAPAPEPMPTETIQPERPVAPVASPPEPGPASDVILAPPPVWSNNELRVSLVVPSSSWDLDNLPPSFDVAVALTNDTSDGRATLALIRQKLRSRNDFRSVTGDVRQSISQAQGFRMIEDEPLALDPYTAHEFRFVKSVGFLTSYNRLVVVYSRDLAYVLSLTCPEEKRAENEADFEALVRGLVVKKPRQEIAF